MAYTRSLKSFLNHRSRESSGTQYLSSWRNRTPPELVCWLHTKVLPAAVWQHNWPRVVDKKDGKKAVWGGSFTCLESEAVLKKQRYRDKKTGKREVPPEVCPICILNEYVRDLVRGGDLDWTDVLFRYRADDDQRILHAGGIYGGFGVRNPTEEQVKELSAADIKLGGPEGAWREEATAKCKYVFRVVDNDEPDKGVQIAVEQELLGQKVQQCIAREIERAMGPKDPDGDQGNPLEHPYAIKFKYAPTEKEFGKRYDAVALPNVELTDKIRELICDTDAPSIARVREPWNIRSMRALMEEACEYGLDWDEIFGPAEARCDANGVYQAPEAAEESDDSTDFDPSKFEPEAEKPTAKKALGKASSQVPADVGKKASGKKTEAKSEPKGRRAVAPPPEDPPAGSEPCVGKNGTCGKMLPPDCFKCPKCGQEYENVGDDPAESASDASTPPF